MTRFRHLVTSQYLRWSSEKKEDIVDEAERMLAISKASQNAANEGQDDGEQENDQEVERDE